MTKHGPGFQLVMINGDWTPVCWEKFITHHTPTPSRTIWEILKYEYGGRLVVNDENDASPFIVFDTDDCETKFILHWT